MSQKRLFRLLALFFSFALIAAACGDDDDTTATGDDDTSTTEGGGGDSDFSGCLVTDEGGVDDRSFNETAFNGLADAGDTVGFEPVVLESADAADYEPNVSALLEEDCSIIVTVGFALGDATSAAAEANPDQLFAIVDNDLADADFNDLTFDNVRELTFATDEAAFLAGYAAAGMTETGKIGTYGGRNFPTVSIFMKGLEAGIVYYNEQNGTDVELIGWSTADDDGLFTGDFEDQAKGRATTETLLDDGADIIMPVAGPVGLGSVEAIRADAGGAKLIWVDTDGCLSVPDACEFFLTSVKKNMDLAVEETVEGAAAGSFQSGLYVGTLENGGVDIASFNEFEDDVPQELKDELEAIRALLVSGELSASAG